MSKTQPSRFDFRCDYNARSYSRQGEFMFYKDYADLEKHYDELLADALVTIVSCIDIRVKDSERMVAVEKFNKKWVGTNK
mgnify:CR=1 FL=1